MANAKLTAGRIRDFQCSPGKAQEFLRDTDTPGLGVRATPGAKAFIFQSRLRDGATIRRTIGDVRSWSLDDARAEARRLQTLIDQGHDPRALEREKAEAKAAAKAAVEAAEQAAKAEAERRQRYTLRALCDAYVDNLRARGKGKTATDTKSVFKVHVVEAWPELAARPAREITAHQIAAVIRKVREAGKERTAGILRNYLAAAYNAARRAPFDSAMSSDLILFEIEANPAEIVPTIPVNRGDRNLSADELKTYMEALGDDAADKTLYVALLAGGQRLAQLVRAKVSDFDVDTGTLRLWDTKGRRTTPREHLLPLAATAAEIVKAMAEKRGRPDALLFGASAYAAGRRVSEISEAMKGEPFDLRDVRRTVETMLAGRLKIHKDNRAQLSSHGISGVQDAHYDRFDYFDEKRNVLTAWEARLEEIATGKKYDNVVEMKHNTAA